MGQPWAYGKRAFGFCDLCGFRYPLKDLKELTVKLKPVNLLACPSCWTPDQPQLQVGMKKVVDPQALRRPRPDNSFVVSGPNVRRFPGEGSRIIFWGWNPVGFNNSEAPGLKNSLIAVGSVGTVIVVTEAITVTPSNILMGAVGSVGTVSVFIGP